MIPEIIFTAGFICLVISIYCFIISLKSNFIKKIEEEKPEIIRKVKIEEEKPAFRY